MERLQAHQRDCETKLAELAQKLQMLQVPDATCPLCDRPLDEQHYKLVVQKNRAEQEEVINQQWVLREQLATSEREIQVLRAEYAQLNQELAGYETLRERRGSLQAQLDATESDRCRLQQMAAEKEQIERALAEGSYSPHLVAELQQLDWQLQQMNYDQKDHALARGQAERWRWAEIKLAEIRTATKSLARVNARKPELQSLIAGISRELEQQQTACEFSRQIAEIDRQSGSLNYDRREHDALRAARTRAQTWLARYQQLLAAQEEYPQLQERAGELARRLQAISQERQAMLQQIESLNRQLQETPDATQEISLLEKQISARRAQLDSQLASLGRLQQQQQHLDELQVQLRQQKQQLQIASKQQRVYQELAAAFGKNGIQALMIENVLPQLEAETNQILSRLTGNQLHVQFFTQRAGKSKRASTKVIETLDILIGDAKGTRPYETYSGGEAFRINFSIRLALSRLLAHRSGTALQMLIVDEGFGSQDAEGCERLIAAINAIAPEFACILTVTHISQFKEAFQARIEVTKTQNGSQLTLSI
jgi:exonuclease SbcC